MGVQKNYVEAGTGVWKGTHNEDDPAVDPAWVVVASAPEHGGQVWEFPGWSAVPTQPKKFQVVEDETDRSTTSSTFVDLPLATITLNQGDGDYIIMFTVRTDTGGFSNYRINIDGVDIEASALRVAAVTGGTTHVGRFITNGKVVKIRYRKSSGSSAGTREYTLTAARTG